MRLAPGTRLGPYEISGLLGAGGMGEVYRARDTRLGRDVAIKVLPEEFAGHPERVRRFEREARAVAALNHPNILAIYDAGVHEGVPYLVTELLEGESLHGKLAEGRLAVRRAVDLASQVAEGLAEAHEKGIVHRDLKPGNVFVTREGRAKILDFGLARLAKGEGDGTPASTAPTADPGTKPGVLLGTVRYMSPEQVKGKAADGRSDVFSLGVMLYEMLSGARPFRGDSDAEVMTAILKEDPPPLAAGDLQIPPLLERTVAHCLEKRPENRFQSARDIVFALESVGFGSDISAALPPLPEDRRRRAFRWVLAGLALVLIATGIWLGGLLQGKHRYQRPIPNFTQITFRRGMITSARFSPDGNTIYYSAAWGGKPLELFAKRLDTVESQPLGIENARVLAVAHGEMAILLRARPTEFAWPVASTLAILPLGGGAPKEVAEHIYDADYAPGTHDLAVVRQVQGSTWAFMHAGGRNRLEYPIGKSLYEANATIDQPRFSPTGDKIAFIERIGQISQSSLSIVDLSGNRKILVEKWARIGGIAWMRSGSEILFSGYQSGSDQHLYCADMKGRVRLVLRTTSDLVPKDIDPQGKVLASRVSVSIGSFGLLHGDSQERDLSWFGMTHQFYLSEDGKTVVFYEERKPETAVYMRREGQPWPVRLGRGVCGWLSPDQKYALVCDPFEMVMRIVPTGPGEVVTLPKGVIKEYAGGVWFPVGNRVYEGGREAGKGPRIWVQDVPDGLPRPITPEGYGSSYGAISPDGRYVACGRFSPGEEVVYSQFPVDGGPPLPIKGIEPGEEPITYGEAGRHIFVREHDEGTAAPICILDLATGRREPWRVIRPSDPAGALRIQWIKISRNGKYYVYCFYRNLSELFLTEGLR